MPQTYSRSLPLKPDASTRHRYMLASFVHLLLHGLEEAEHNSRAKTDVRRVTLEHR